MMRAIWVVVLGIVICSVASAEPPSFYENSIRRSPLEGETVPRAMVHIDGRRGGWGNCAGSFIKNSSGAVLLLTARHCFDYKATDWCNAKGEAFLDTPGRPKWSCKRLVASTRETDFVLFEMEGGPAPEYGLALAGFSPRDSMDLMMYGYPSDSQALPGLNVTENCWVRSATAPRARVEPREITADRFFFHNCSTYGGNSGGPLVLKGTDIVLGFPDVYERDNLDNFSSWKHVGIQGVRISDFVARHREALDALGVEITDVATGHSVPSPSALQLESGVFGTDCKLDGEDGWKITVQALYETRSALSRIKTWWETSTKAARLWEYSPCTSRDGVLRCELAGDANHRGALEVVDATTLRYFPNGGGRPCVLKSQSRGRY